MGKLKMKLLFAICATVFVALFLIQSGCGSSDGPSDRDVLISLTDDVIVPAFQDLELRTAQLQQSVDVLCSTPSTDALAATRESWRTARAAWMRSEAMWFGPVMDRRSTGLLDWSPTDTDGIDDLLLSGTAPTKEEAREILASDRRGFGAMEHLLFGSNVLANPQQGVTACAYLTSLASISQEETSAIHVEWTEGTDGLPAQRDYYSDRAGASILPSAAIAEVVRTQYFLIRDIVDMRLAGAMGLRDGPADLTVIPGNVADNGLEDIRNELIGIQTIYEGSGTEGLGIGDLVSQLSEDTDDRLRDRFDATFAAIDEVTDPFRDALVQPTSQLQILFDRLSDIQLIIGTEVVSLLGVSVGFTDTDGDSMR